MGLRKKQRVSDDEDKYQVQEPTRPGEPVLPGLAGWRTKEVSKNGMPQSRFNYVRPDGKRDQ